MPQNEHIELAQKRFGKRLDQEEKIRKRKSRHHKEVTHKAKTLRGRHAHVFQEKIKAEKAILNAKIKDFKKSKNKNMDDDSDYIKEGSVPAYLMERNETKRSKVLSNSVKQKRKERGQVGRTTPLCQTIVRGRDVPGHAQWQSEKKVMEA